MQHTPIRNVILYSMSSLFPFRSALDQKKGEEKNIYGTIDYDAPIASEPSKIGLGTKVADS